MHLQPQKLQAIIRLAIEREGEYQYPQRDFGLGPKSRGLIELIQQLSEDEQKDLLALLWLGRGDGDSWAEVRARAEAQFNSSSPGYLEAKKPLADYLIRGICVLARGRDGAP